MKIFLSAIICFISFQLEAQSVASSVQSNLYPSANTITYKIIIVANGTFCYDIFNGDHRIIHQTSKPCLPGNKGFIRKSDAEKVAGLVVKKLQRNIMPPTVTIREMDSLKIRY